MRKLVTIETILSVHEHTNANADSLVLAMVRQGDMKLNEYYVYIYLDPITNIPFYVGYGKGNRYMAHLNEVKRNYIGGNKHKYSQLPRC